ncbi:MAG: sugar transferase [Flavobacteriales bacterium]|jgi:lipopolysaccharide/colanic/teichoic acid biosynthesis glycosyltransferase
MIKRLFDVFCSGLGLLFLLPFFIILSIIIVVDSSGGVFYKQVRVGKNSIDFYLYKFRSMKIDSDKKDLLTVGGNDSRITKVGYFIRRYKMDELSQLINVFLGDMSLVGPRPEVRKYVNLYTTEQLKVLTVKPGITDNASIAYFDENELLGKSSDPEETYVREIMPSKLALNLLYVNDHSLFSDVKIILRTIKTIFT